MLYFDTSYIVRLYTTEPGWQKVRALAATDAIVCSMIGYVETSAAFHRKFRENAITQKDLVEMFRQFNSDITSGAFNWQPITLPGAEFVSRLFESLPKTTFLRAADALHLQTAASLGLKDIYSNDRKLLHAAPHFGLHGLNVI